MRAGTDHERVAVMNGCGSSGLRRYRLAVPALSLSVSILLVYWGVQYQEFIHFDDYSYVVENRHVQGGLSGAGVLWALQSMEVSNWHPLTWLSLMADYELYGLYPGGYHWTNVLLHILGTLLLFLTLERMTQAKWRSLVVALLFGIHPLHVESVAWISERKDVLSGLFWMASLWFYALYAERGRWRWYLAVLTSFALGLLSKPMVVTLPCVLLLLDYWPLGRFSDPGKRNKRFLSLVLEKAPFFVLAAISSVVTYRAQLHGKAVTSLDFLPFPARLANAFVSYGLYCLKMVWPADLAVFYPHPESWSFLPVGLALVFFMAASCASLYYYRRYPYVFTGWWWYVGMLAPVIGLVQVGGQAMADRYTYLPLIGLFVVITWGLADLVSRLAHRWQVIIAGLGVPFVIISLMVTARVQASYWQGSVSLFEHALAVTRNNYLAHDNLGLALLEDEKFAEAGRQFREAIQIKPNYAPAYNNFGVGLTRQGRSRESIVWFEKALQINPELTRIHFNLAEALFSLGRFDEAISRYRLAMDRDPDNPFIHNNLGVALMRQGNLAQAAAEFRGALQLDPRHAGAHNNLAMLLLSDGEIEEAVSHFRQALAIRPDFANARYQLARALKRNGCDDKADSLVREEESRIVPASRHE